jgi:hypothetical protein
MAALIRMHQMGRRPRAIVMCDPGSEREGTHRYRLAVANPWLRSVGFPEVTVISRKEEGLHRARAWQLETLEEECLRIHALPSIAYGWKKCSQKYKGEPSRWWLARQPWAQAEWAAGRKLVKAIGYDFDEPERVAAAFQNPWEVARLVPWYPLFEAKLARAAAVELIRSQGLPVPPKSSCTFCPSNQLAEWKQLRAEEPEAFARAVAMSRNAASHIESPDVVGLMRCQPRGMRQLHVWADGGYPETRSLFADDEPSTEGLPCDCAL